MNFRLLISIMFTSTIVFAIGVNDEVELLQFVNARASANFKQDADNVKAVLAKGSRGKVTEVKKFASGNFGFLLDVKTGKLKDQKVWVYYNPKSPSLKLYDEKQNPVAAPVDAKSAVATRDVPVVREPSADPLPTAALPGQVIRANDSVAAINGGNGNSSACATCAAAQDYSNQPGTNRTLQPGQVEVSVDAQGNLNAKVSCSHKDDMAQAWPGKMEVVIENNKVTYLNAQIDGCRVTLEEFKQVEFPNKNIVLRNADGCAVTFMNNQKSRKTDYAVLAYGMVPDEKCVKSCKKVEKKFWQVEANPQTKVCN